MDVKIATPAEHMYMYSQSQQISMQSGLIGYLRADMDTNGEGFFTTWNDFRKDLKAQEFKDEFDSVINELRKDGNFLRNRSALSKYCNSHPEASAGKDEYKSERNFGVRINTEKYAYMLRLNPYKGEYNLYCYCYVREWFDNHLQNAGRGIRFISPDYEELFRIPDGDKVRIITENGEKLDRVCRYIDDYHLEVGSNLFYICEFAERMEQNNNTVIPMRNSLPERAYAVLPSDGRLIIISKGENRYTDASYDDNSPEKNKSLADGHNREMGVTKAQAEAMLAGAVLGWQCPAADPKNYDENGKPIRPKHIDRGDER